MKVNMIYARDWIFAVCRLASVGIALAASGAAWGQDPPAPAAAEQSGVVDTTPPVPPLPVPASASPMESAPEPTAPAQTSDAPMGPLPVEALAAGGAPSSASASLPHDLSPWSMFQSADVVVKAVMIGLVFASVVTWTVWLAKSIELAFAKRKLRWASRALGSAASLAEASQQFSGKRGVAPGMVESASLELRLSADIADKAGIKERVASRLDGIAAAAGRDINMGTGVLATIGSTAPFVGLFGTVWGIMNSFIGISEAQTTNLAIVAPGIAEALLATAIGLVAAIPAVIIYNQFARSISAYRASIGEASAEILRLLSRDLDRGIKTIQAQAAE